MVNIKHLKSKLIGNLLLLMFVSSRLIAPSVAFGQVTEVATSAANSDPALNQAMNLTLSPVSLALETDPGVPVSTTIKIRNNSQLPERLTISFGSFIADESGQKPQLLDPAPNQEFLKWMTADPGNLTVNSGEWANVNLTFAPPTTAALGYYYAVYISRSQQEVKAGETLVQGSPAILVLTTVKSPNAKRQLELTDFQVTQPFTEFLPQTFQVTVKNTGNIHVVPTGNIFIDGQRQKDLAVLSINPAAASVLPQSSRTFTVAWNDGFPFYYPPDATAPPSTGFRFMSLEWDLARANTFRAGPYTAHLLMVYDNGERDVPIESFVSFWVLPWKLLLLGLGITLFAIVGIASTLRNLWKKIKNHWPPSSPS